MSYNQQEVVVHWFRHGLRLHDNPALIEGLAECDKFYPVFIFDGEVAGTIICLLIPPVNDLVSPNQKHLSYQSYGINIMPSQL